MNRASTALVRRQGPTPFDGWIWQTWHQPTFSSMPVWHTDTGENVWVTVWLPLPGRPSFRCLQS
eukprot:3331929-Amphidinium_carterae.1